MKAMPDTQIGMHLAGRHGGLEGRFVVAPPEVDSVSVLRVVDENGDVDQRRVDPSARGNSH